MQEEDTTEEWRAVPGWEGSYEVSSAGRVRSLGWIVVESSGMRRRKSGRVLAPTGLPERPMVCLKRDGRRRPEQIAVLVCEAFHGPRPAGMECCHNDGDSTNNHAGNLRWDTRSANQMDRVRHGTSKRGERHHAARLTVAGVREIRRLRGEGLKQREIAARFGVARGTVNSVLNGYSWAHTD